MQRDPFAIIWSQQDLASFFPFETVFLMRMVCTSWHKGAAPHFMRHSRKHFNSWDSLATIYATTHSAGPLEMILTIDETRSGIPLDIQELLYRAIYNDMVDCARVLMNRGATPSDISIGSVVTKGNVDMMRILPAGCIKSEHWTAAACLGHMQSLEYFASIFLPLDGHACNAAVYAGRLDCLEFLRNIQSPWDRMTLFAAVQISENECLDYALKNGCPVPTNIYRKAMLWGNKSALVALRAHEVPIEDTACLYAATEGELDLLIFLHEAGAHWDERTCSSASEAGHLNCLQYAHENGCKWDESAAVHASIHDEVACLEYAIENGCPLGDASYESIIKAQAPGCMRYLEQKGLNDPLKRNARALTQR